MHKYPCNYTIQFSEPDGGFVARCNDKPYQLLAGWNPNTPIAALAELLFVMEDVEREQEIEKTPLKELADFKLRTRRRT